MLPLTDTQSNCHRCLDLNPAPGGSVGQVISFLRDDGAAHVVAPSFRGCLEAYAGTLAAGHLEFPEDRFANYLGPDDAARLDRPRVVKRPPGGAVDGLVIPGAPNRVPPMLPRQPDRPRRKPDLLVPIPMQCVAGSLFLLGLPWAFLAGWACLLNLFGGIEQLRLAILEGDPAEVDQVLARMPLVIAGLAQAVWGYTIWGSWWRIAGDEKVVSRRFWFQATGHHLIWAALFLGVMVWPVSGSHLSIDGSVELFVLGDILGVGLICLVTGWVIADPPRPSEPIPDDWLSLA